jgi:hypothetical protein
MRSSQGNAVASNAAARAAAATWRQTLEDHIADAWTERAAKPAAKSREPVPDLEIAVRAGNVADMTASFLADLLEDDD